MARTYYHITPKSVTPHHPTVYASFVGAGYYGHTYRAWVVSLAGEIVPLFRGIADTALARYAGHHGYALEWVPAKLA